MNDSGPRYPSVVELIERARSGDAGAGEELARQSYTYLRKVAHGRIPRRVRGQEDTDDLVQMTLLRALRILPGFKALGEYAWFAYLRRILANLLRDEARRASRMPAMETVDETLRDERETPSQHVAHREALRVYQRVLAEVPEPQRSAIILRVEHGLRYAAIAERLGLPSTDAARMTVRRALDRINREHR